ncbi:MAG: hypothetical protein V3U54_08175 [Thermodesulfobacteriota bacterium]
MKTAFVEDTASINVRECPLVYQAPSPYSIPSPDETKERMSTCFALRNTGILKASDDEVGTRIGKIEATLRTWSQRTTSQIKLVPPATQNLLLYSFRDT